MSPDELSQDDIDALLSGAAFGGEESSAGAESAGGEASGGTPEDSALLSQEELEAVLAGGGEEQQVSAPDFSDFSQTQQAPISENTLDMLYDVHLDVKIELGRCEMVVQDILRLNEGSVVELEKLAGDPVDILVNGKLIAKGEILVLNDQFCVRITDIISPRGRLDSAIR